MCDERTDHTGLCRPLLSNLHSFTPYCDIGPASEDISCSVRPLRCFRFVPEPCSGFPFEIMLTETLLQRYFQNGTRLWSGSIATMPGSCPRAFLHFSNFLDTLVLDQEDCTSKESCHVGVGVDRDNRPRYLIDYLLPVILTAHIFGCNVKERFFSFPPKSLEHSFRPGGLHI